MKWLSKILGGSGEQQPEDPVIAECWSIAREYGLSLNEEEWEYVRSNRDKIVASPLGGKFLHKEVFHVLCFLCLFDAMFDFGMDMLQAGADQHAIDPLEKARKLLPWPTVLIALGTAYAHSGDIEAALQLRDVAIDGFEPRMNLLSPIVPTSVPDRDKFLRAVAERIDATVNALGFDGMASLKDAMSR